VLAPGSLSRVLLGLSWNFVMTTNVMTGIDSLLPDHSRQLRQSVVTSSDLFLWPVDFTDELPDITYLPESTKFHFFLLQLMAAYETSLLSRSITFEGIPFWHAIPNRCNPPCVICVGVCSFFPLNQITEMGVCNQPGFFPHNFNSLCSIEYLKLLRLRPDGIVYLYSNRDDLLQGLLCNLELQSLRCSLIQYSEPVLQSMEMLVQLGAQPTCLLGWNDLAMNVRSEFLSQTANDHMLGRCTSHASHGCLCNQMLSVLTFSMLPSCYTRLRGLGFPVGTPAHP
jgi:hypothetical protein